MASCDLVRHTVGSGRPDLVCFKWEVVDELDSLTVGLWRYDIAQGVLGGRGGLGLHTSVETNLQMEWVLVRTLSVNAEHVILFSNHCMIRQVSQARALALRPAGDTGDHDQTPWLGTITLGKGNTGEM